MRADHHRAAHLLLVLGARLEVGVQRGDGDELVDVRAASNLFDAIQGPKAAGWLAGAEHDLTSRHEAAHQTARSWIIGLLRRSRVCSGMLTQLQLPEEASVGIPFGKAVTF